MTPKGFASKERYQRFLSAALRAHLVLGLPAAERRCDGGDRLEHARISALWKDLGDSLSGSDAAPSKAPAGDLSFAWGWDTR